MEFPKQFDGPIEAALRRRVAVSFVVAVFLTGFMGLLAWRTRQLASSESDLVAHTYFVMNTLEVTLQHVAQVESSAWAFSLTGLDPLLAQYKNAGIAVVQDEKALRHLTADNPSQQRRLDALEPQVQAVLQFAESMAAKRRHMLLDPGANDILETERLKDAVRATTQEMKAAETQLLRQRIQETGARLWLTDFITIMGLLLGASLLALAKFAINREIDVSAQGRTQISNTNAQLEQRVEQRTAALQSEITERKRTDVMLERLAAMVESSDDAIISKTLDGKITAWNQGAKELFGYSSFEAIGKSMRILFPPERMNEEFDILTRIGRGERVDHFETVRVRKDGKNVDVSETISPIKDSSGAIVGASNIARDITERMSAEKVIRKFNDELEQRVMERTAQLETANKELEAFSYSVSHDLRAPLRHISGFSKTLMEEFGSTLDPSAKHYLERIQAGTQKMGLLVDELLNLARVGRHALHLRSTALNAIVAEVITILQPESEGRWVEWVIADLPPVECDPVLVKQVFQNLLANALKFTGPRGGAGGSERARTPTPTTLHTVIEVSYKVEDGRPVFMVRDNGVGFKMKYVDKLFGVFQRLHSAEEFEGTGIGLVTVRRIVNKHGGRVWAEGEPDKGAAFYFTLGVGKQVESKSSGATAGGQS
jgi:PAS domain S-box-containing protein